MLEDLAERGLFNNLVPMDLYHMEASPPSRAVRMVARHLNLGVNLIPINMMVGEHLSAQFLAVRRLLQCIAFIVVFVPASPGKSPCLLGFDSCRLLRCSTQVRGFHIQMTKKCIRTSPKIRLSNAPECCSYIIASVSLACCSMSARFAAASHYYSTLVSGAVP